MDSIELNFLKSSLELDSQVFPNAEILSWIKERRNAIAVHVSQVPLQHLSGWIDEGGVEGLMHTSGKFFSISGIMVTTNWGNIKTWCQPIINQPEVGYLGFIARKFNGILHFLVQAKIEPGNINVVQISPTLQATKSNYTRVHGGRQPLFLEYFNGEKEIRVLVDQLQSEQGARFLRKRNRNIIVEIPETDLLPEHPDFKWMTIGQIKTLMRHDNIINMDTRTVISGILYGSYSTKSLELLQLISPKQDSRNLMTTFSMLNSENALINFTSILSWIANLKSKYEIEVSRISLKDVSEWNITDEEICRNDKKFFTVIGVSVAINSREVTSWDQPMIKPAQEGLVAFIAKSIKGILHFLVQAKLEPGNLDIIEIAPTVQCLTGNYRSGLSDYTVPYIKDVLSASKNDILYDTMQSEEGGRFFKEENRNMIIQVGDSFPIETPENYNWMTLNQLLRLIEFNNYLNISARSLISAITYGW